MSIIYDALKKVEDSSKLTPQVSVQEKNNKLKNFLIYLTVTTIGIIIANILFNIFIKPAEPIIPLNPAPDKTPISSSQATDSILMPNTPKAPTNSTAPLLEPFKSKEQSEAPGFTLTGIFFSAGERYALINNRIMKKGDTIDGARVKEITANNVELDFEGSNIKLSTNN